MFNNMLFIKRSGGIDGRPTSLYIRSKMGESSLSASICVGLDLTKRMIGRYSVFGRKVTEHTELVHSPVRLYCVNWFVFAPQRAYTSVPSWKSATN
ncbi:MAG: hypothetical protein KAJ17_04470, partial [Candidatus Krumholzibacteria bacterium]|nr:hypothetical protein [Candidatus Krumholzibacteria bacterium]